MTEYHCTECGHIEWDVLEPQHLPARCPECGHYFGWKPMDRPYVTPAELLKRLKEARKIRTEHERSPSLSYCMICDDAVLAIRNRYVYDDDGEVLPVVEYDRLDCSDEHYNWILHESHDNAEISAWIDCLEYILDVEQSLQSSHAEIAEDAQESMNWPLYYASGEYADAENFIPVYYRVEGPNGPVSYMNPNGGPYYTTMYDFAMESRSDDFHECDREDTPWRVE